VSARGRAAGEGAPIPPSPPFAARRAIGLRPMGEWQSKYSEGKPAPRAPLSNRIFSGRHSRARPRSLSLHKSTPSLPSPSECLLDARRFRLLKASGSSSRLGVRASTARTGLSLRCSSRGVSLLPRRSRWLGSSDRPYGSRQTRSTARPVASRHCRSRSARLLLSRSLSRRDPPTTRTESVQA
jgi:hypothetical protein